MIDRTRYLLSIGFASVAILLGGLQPAAAQSVVGYGVIGPAVNSKGYGGFALHGAGGAEVLLGGIAGVGAETGILFNASSALSVTSVNGSVHVPLKIGEEGASPYVTGGYSRFASGEGTSNAWNIGAGANLWPSRRAGLRIELRDHIRPSHLGMVHYIAVRAGIAFRSF